MIRLLHKPFFLSSCLYKTTGHSSLFLNNASSMHWHSTITVEHSVSNNNGRLRLVEDEYCSDHSTPFPPKLEKVLNDLAKETIQKYANCHMMNSKTAALNLRQWVYLFQPKHALEIGTFTGYSTIAMASALPSDDNHKLISLEKDSLPLETASKYVELAGLQNRVTLMQGDAQESLMALAKNKIQFDLIFLDADKGGYIKYYDTIMENNLLSDTGVFLADNVLYFGQVHRESGYPEHQPTAASKNIKKVASKVHEFNKHVKEDDRVQMVMLPVFDGLTIIKKKLS